jgi:hypothetical protein
MTIAAAWTRTIRDCEELVFVSDSRLSGGARTFDFCPKILTLPRSDCAISFAGSTDDAYPLMLQLSLAIDSYAPARRGSMDLSALRSHAIKVFDSMASSLRSDHHELTTPDVAFLFGGYSWVQKRFLLWTLRFNSAEERFEAVPAKSILCAPNVPSAYIGYHPSTPGGYTLGKIAFAGDQSAVFRDRLLAMLTQIRDSAPDPTKLRLDWEPLAVVRDMLRADERAQTIGGAPQIVKVYQYMRTAPLAVLWKHGDVSRPHLLGRPALGYEQLDHWVVNPDTFVSSNPAYSRHDVDDARPEVSDEPETGESG